MNNNRLFFRTAKQMEQARQKRRQQEIAAKATLVIEGFMAGVVLSIVVAIVL